MIEFIGYSGTNYNLRINGRYAGTLEPKEDGYWDWYPELNNPGYIPAYILRAIADKLDELNKEWDEQVQRDLG